MHQDQDRHPLGKNVDGWNTLKPASHLHTRSPPTKKKMNWLYQEDLVLPCNLAMPNKYFFIYLSINSGPRLVNGKGTYVIYLGYDIKALRYSRTYYQG